MRTFSILFTLVVSNLLAACSTDFPPPPDGPPETSGPTTIHIRSDQAPAFVVFRDGLDAPWQAATMAGPTFYTAEVHGPYMVTVVCEDPATGRSRTLQVARTLDDVDTFTLSCDLPVMAMKRSTVTGHMVQAGFVQLGSSSDSSDVADWDFQLSAADGLYDLVATTADRIRVQRGFEVKGDLEVSPPVDVAAEGEAFADVAFTAATATADETLAASVDFLTAKTPTPVRIYAGPAATAKAVRNITLIDTDTQRAAVRATSGTAVRELRRSFRIGDDTAYTLPPSLGGVQWVSENGQLSASWTTLPPLDQLDVSAMRFAADGSIAIKHDLAVTPAFLVATGTTHITIDTEIPDYKPAWRIDFAGAYTRDLTTEKTVKDERATSSVTEAVNAPQTDAGGTTSRTAGAHVLR
jgi:hypothetical protein